MRYQSLFLISLVTVGAIYIAAVAAVAVFLDPASGFGFVTKDVAWLRFIARLAHLRPEPVMEAVAQGGYRLPVMYGVGWLVTIATLRKNESRTRTLYFLSQPIIVWPGWMGLLMMPATLWYGVDGEWFSEGFPLFIAAGAWVMCSLTIGILSLDWRRVLPSRLLASITPVA